MRLFFGLVLITSLALIPVAAPADELTRIIQNDLATLGYDPGNTDGEADMKTVVAVSKFQAEHDLEVTGEMTPQLAGIIKASIKQRDNPGQGVASASEKAGSQRSEEELQAAQEVCLQEKYETAKASKKKGGFGKLLSAVSEASTKLGKSKVSRKVSKASRDIYIANASAEATKKIADDLGLTEDDLEACRNP